MPVGIASGLDPVHTVDASVYRKQFEVNTLGPLFMYKATYPLLIETREKDSNLPAPKFFVTSSGLGSMGGFYSTFIVAPYGMSKAAVNYLALSIHHQTEKVGAVVIPYHPGKLFPLARPALSSPIHLPLEIGLVLTDMNTKSGVDVSGFPGAISPEQGGAEFADLIVKATRAEHGGKFFGQGTEGPLPW